MTLRNKLKLYFIITTLGVLGVFSACKKTEVKIPDAVTPVNDTIKQVVFDTGSWWEYQRRDAGTVDTVYVKSLTHGQAKFVSGGTGYNLEYYKTVYHIASNGKEYSLYYYDRRAKFECNETDLIGTGQEFYFSNTTWGAGMERNTHGCTIEDKEFSILYFNRYYHTVCRFEINYPEQWDKSLFTAATTYYYFNTEAGFLRFYLAGRLGWAEDEYTIKTFHVNLVP